MSNCYFDDSEEGLARETSHPFFVEHASADFYYDCTDDFSPFGNDSGADTLLNLEDWYRERGAGEKVARFLRRQIEEWDFNAEYLKLVDLTQLDTIDREEQSLNNELDRAVIATVFGQYKIAGKADKTMLAMAELAFRRQRYVAEKALIRVGDPWEYATEYLNRLTIMEADLAAMSTKKAR
ncbi:hypothetical protein [Hymenobacter guriensis]|uniref:MolR family transcriptional regulator n=1 Tax=Hymenobacter guriensis TaxID=2793065 RepID=A0ABS0L3D0_9BACT|nr:hypothetical protein [Hymenobacter guriensis]MBG8554630.1 MolR family transcriptional regulator [Hymenobacter guriensis]